MIALVTSHPSPSVRAGLRRADALRIRPGMPGDLDAMRTFLAGLSERTSYLRFLTGFGRNGPPPGLARQLLLPRAPGGSLLAFHDGSLIGHAMWGAVADVDDPAHSASTAEIAILVADAHQGRGLGSRLADEVARYARGQGFARLQAVVSAENHVVRNMIVGRVRDARYDRDGALVTVTVRIGSLARPGGPARTN